jgi:hypothetical protein
MGNETFEKEYLELLDKHDIPVAVIMYQHGTTLCIRGAADDEDPISQIRCQELGALASKVVKDMKESKT